MLEANWTALKLFLDASTQWRVASIGGGLTGSTLVRLGLDYAGLDALMRRRRIRDEAIFDDVRLMEGAALRAFSGAEDGGPA